MLNFQLLLLSLFICCANLSAQEFAQEGWVLWYDQNQFAAEDVPNSFIEKQKQLASRPNAQVNSVGLAPDGGWVIAYLNKASTDNKAHLSWDGTHKDFMQILQPINEQNSTIQQIVFSPLLTYDRQSWVILYDNYHADWKNLPETLIQKIIELSQASKNIKSIGLAANGAWVLVADNNEIYAESISPALDLAIKGLKIENKPIHYIAFNLDGGWLLLHGKNGALWDAIPNNLIKQITALQEKDAQIKGASFFTIKGKL